MIPYIVTPLMKSLGCLGKVWEQCLREVTVDVRVGGCDCAQDRFSKSLSGYLPRLRRAEMRAAGGARRMACQRSDTPTTSDKAMRRRSARPFGLRRHRAVYGVALPRRISLDTPSSSLLVSGPPPGRACGLALATQSVRDNPPGRACGRIGSKRYPTITSRTSRGRLLSSFVNVIFCRADAQ